MVIILNAFHFSMDRIRSRYTSPGGFKTVKPFVLFTSSI